jgi:hypothetical protein
VGGHSPSASISPYSLSLRWSVLSPIPSSFAARARVVALPFYSRKKKKL